jgi:hypothetical protein
MSVSPMSGLYVVVERRSVSSREDKKSAQQVRQHVGVGKRSNYVSSTTQTSRCEYSVILRQRRRGRARSVTTRQVPLYTNHRPSPQPSEGTKQGKRETGIASCGYVRYDCATNHVLTTSTGLVTQPAPTCHIAPHLYNCSAVCKHDSCY